MTLPSLADFDGYCEEHDVQSGQYGVALAQWLANIAGRPMTGELADGQGATFTAEPEGVDSSTWLAGDCLACRWGFVRGHPVAHGNAEQRSVRVRRLPGVHEEGET